MSSNKAIRVKTNNVYVWDPEMANEYTNYAHDWAVKTDGMVSVEGAPVDYSAKAYAIGGSGTETNNAKYYAAQAAASASEVSGKADKATTLAGYGITDAYTKTEIDNMIGDIEALLSEV
jgi:hypothetical protein